MPLYTTKKSNKLRASMFDEKPAKDYDPEAEPRNESDESGSEVDSDVERAETEHYVTVGKSKLRKAEAPTLGPEYSGTRVSREALEQSDEEDFDDEEEDDEEDDEEDEEDDDESGSEEFADPDTADLERDHIDDDAEISSDNALGEDDENWAEKFTFRGSSKPKTPAKTPSKKDDLALRIKKRPTAADFMSGSEDDEEEEEDDEDLEDDEDDEEDSEEGEQNGLFDMEAEETEDDEGEDDEEELEGAMLSGSEDEEGDSEEDDEDGEEGSGDEDEDEDEDEEDESGDDDKNDVNAELKKIMAEDEKKIVSTFSKAAQADAQKGVAVRSQRRIFDSILNLRIRLQKALIAANTFNCVEKPDKFKEKPYKAAEEAAVKLWNTIDSVRNSFLPEQVKAKAGEKRKRDAIELDTPDQDIWDALEAVEGPANKYRRQVLDKWSTRVRSTTASMTKERRLAQSAGSQSLVSVLDDQLLSADRLIKKARTPRSCAPVQAAKKVEEDAEIYDDADFYQLLLKELVDQRSSDSAAPGESVATVRWAALKEAKTRKQVDRKASKGRKLRFTVHEKLQNFMAPEDRRSWEEHAIDRFFGTLFGQKMVLKEDEEAENGEDEDEEMGGVSVEEAGLKLFRS